MSERTVFQSITKKHVLSLGPQATVWEAACVMTRAGTGSVLIVDTPGNILGIVTERDLMTRVLAKAADPKTTTVSDVMTRNPYTVKPETLVS
ncbi:MAG: CBS domain-containing protein, partial [Betaproteobacteria bacterium]|nr:CBS domain-containing protein [Betaproteobacteria bacterium]